MIDNASVIDEIRKCYPDVTEESALYLAQRILAWLTILGNSALKRVEDAKTLNQSDWEIRAVILSTSVIARMFSESIKNQDELNSLNSLSDWLLTSKQEFTTSL
jgi:hypothetical protein